MLMGLGARAQSTYTKITSESELNAGDKVLLVGIDDNGQAWAMSYQKPNNRKALEVSMNDDVIVTTVATDPASQTEPFEITIGGQAGAWTFFDELGDGYLYAPGGGNYLKTQATNDDKGEWTLSMEGEGFVPTSNGGVEQNIMRYNVNTQNNDPLFGCYKSTSNVTGLVYIFKAGGAPVIHPEPSNYPTNFAASVDGLNVTLTWTDATGNQLPAKYLVVASTGAITVPTDGTPVANDGLHQNVSFGAEQVTFYGLQANATYHFAIFPYTNSGANIDYKTDGNYPTAEAVTPYIQFLVNENFDEGLGVFTAYNVIGEQEWHLATYQGTTYANMNGYASGANHENEDWLISPELAFNPPYSDLGVVMSFNTAMKFDGNPLLVLVSTEYEDGEDPNDYEWVDITDAFDFSSGNYEWVESGEVEITNLIPSNGTFHVAFYYACSDQAASSWEIGYVTVSVVDLTSVGENAAATLEVYPNPAHELVSVSLDDNAQVMVYDMTGRMVLNTHMSAGVNNLNVAQFGNGVYFINVRYTDGKSAVTRFVKF